MKFSEIQNLYEQTEVKKLGKPFYIDLYRFCIDLIEKLDDEFLFQAFENAANCDSNIEQISVSKFNNNFNIELWKTGFKREATRDIMKKDDQDFEFHGFKMFFSLNPEEPNVALMWNKNNGFDLIAARKIFGEYLISKSANPLIISREFFK